MKQNFVSPENYPFKSHKFGQSSFESMVIIQTVSYIMNTPKCFSYNLRKFGHDYSFNAAF